MPLAQLEPAALGGVLLVVELVRDLIPDLAQWGGYVVDNVEGFAVDVDAVAYVVTDNVGVDGSSGEMFFWSIGRLDG